MPQQRAERRALDALDQIIAQLEDVRRELEAQREREQRKRQWRVINGGKSGCAPD